MFAKDAYTRVKGEWSALRADQLLKVNLDIPLAAQTILGNLPEMKALRGRMVKELPTLDIASFDKLEDYVLALVVVNSAYVMATQPPDDLAELTAEATRLRLRLTADVKAKLAPSRDRHGRPRLGWRAPRAQTYDHLPSCWSAISSGEINWRS